MLLFCRWAKNIQRNSNPNAALRLAVCFASTVVLVYKSRPGMTPEFISRNCPLCGRGNSEPALEKGALHLVRCLQCPMVYANPVPTDLASGEYYDRAAADYYLSPAKLRSDYADIRFERELRLFRKYCARGTVLDVGCSSGGFLYQLKKRFGDCYDVLGTDASGPALAYAESRGLPVRRGSFLDQALPHGSFDAITFWAVLEHLLEPARFLQHASRLLKPTGLCFVLVPNFESLATRVLGARYRYIYPQHLNYFTRAALTAFAGRRFSMLELRSTHFNPLVVWQDWRHRGRNVSNPERAALLERTTGLKQNPALRPIKVLYRLCEMSLGAVNLADNLAAVLINRPGHSP